MNCFNLYTMYSLFSNRILKHFNTNSEKFSVIFTSGATEALKIVAEYFAWDNDNQLNKTGEII